MEIKKQATEDLDLGKSLELMEYTRIWVSHVIVRLKPLLPSRQLRILEVGAAQGRALIALGEMGHDAFGIEPHPSALAVAGELSVHEDVPIRITKAVAEKIPFETNSFDLVLAFSVMEHVDDISLSLKEIYRVLKPGGIFWFSSASAMCPRQNEIKGFPLFAWYPDRLKKYVMRTVQQNKPELVGFTEKPALHWWTTRSAKKRLRAAGFKDIWNRWQLRTSDEDGRRRAQVIAVVGKHKVLQMIGDVLVPGCSFAARKQGEQGPS